MKYIELEVKTTLVIHGYDKNNNEIIEEVYQNKYSKKLIQVDRIKSITDKFLLVSASQGRMFYWEYKGDLEILKNKLAAADLMVS